MNLMFQGKNTLFGKGLLAASMLTLFGCSTPGEDVAFNRSIYVNTSETDAADALAREKAAEQRDASDQQGRKKAPTVFINGSGEFAKKPPAVQQVRRRGDGGVSLTFKNTDIRIVIRAVLGDTLGLSYVVDPRVTGNVTLETSGSIHKDALRMTLESLLKTKGYALVETSDGYVVLPVDDAPRTVEKLRYALPASVNLPGFSVHVVPLSYTLASEMKELMQPFSPQGGILRADDDRSLLILAGTSQEISSMLRAVETFDVSKMAGKSFAIYSLEYVEADEIVKELEHIFSGEKKEAGLPVKFIPIPRINRVIAIADNKELLRTVEDWIGRLDLGESAPGRRIYVYNVKNGRAADMSDTLNLIIGAQYGRRQGGIRGAGGRNAVSSSGRGGASPGPGGNALSQTATAGGQYDEGIRIVPNEESNSIMIMATPSEFAVVESALRQIDLPPRQVLVEVTLAEIGLTDELRYGLQWHFEFGSNTVAFGQSASPAAQFPGFSWANTANSSASAVLNAIESMTDVKVISSPKILVLNNESATIQVGDEVPVPTSSAVSTNDSNAPIVNSIQYRNTGVILTVTPRINEGGLVLLDVEQEMSNVVETASSGIDAPTVQQRKMTSSIAVQNGSTVALGGLISSSASKVKSGVPLLKDIPLLGNAFRSTDLVERRTELVVLLTPRIIRNVQETQEVMDYLTREFRSLMPAEPQPDEAP